MLADMVWRRGYVDDQMGVAFKRLDFRRPAWIPDVFADIDSDSGLPYRIYRAEPAALKVSLFVKHAIIRQIGLAVYIHELAVDDYGGGIVDVRSVRVHETDYRDQPGGCGNDAVQRFPVVLDELGFEQQV